MAFNIHQKLFNRNGELLEDAARQYQDQLLTLFEQSPEWQEFWNEDRSTGWTSMLLDYGFNYVGVTPPQMSPDHLREILFEIFPRKVTTPAESAPDVIAEVLAFWQFLQREFHLENAAATIALLDQNAIRELKEVLSGHAFESGGRLPYQPLVEALRSRLEEENAPEDLLEDLWLAELSRLLPELRERYPDLPTLTRLLVPGHTAPGVP